MLGNDTRFNIIFGATWLDLGGADQSGFYRLDRVDCTLSRGGSGVWEMRKVPSKSKLKWIQSNSGKKKKLKFVRGRLRLSNALSHLQSLCLCLCLTLSLPLSLFLSFRLVPRCTSVQGLTMPMGI